MAVALRSMPVVESAVAAGDLSYGKVRLLALAPDDRTAESFERDETLLVDAARRFGTDDLARVVSHWKACADPDGVSADRAAQWTRRRAAIVQGLDDSWVLSGTIDAESGALVAGVWRQLVNEMRRADSCASSSTPTR